MQNQNNNNNNQNNKRIQELEELLVQKDKVIKLLLENAESQKLTNEALVNKLRSQDKFVVGLPSVENLCELTNENGQPQTYNLRDGRLQITSHCDCEACNYQRNYSFYSTSTNDNNKKH